MTGLGNCATSIENMVIGINANGASISPDPRIARDYSQPVQFTLTAPDGTKVVYNVTVKGAECLPGVPVTPVTPVNPTVPDTTPPVITVLGTNALTLTVGTAYTEAGATCVDDKDPTCSVVTTGTVNTAAVGTYTITYTATDAAGNASSKTRAVTVVPATTPVDTMPTGATIADRWFTDNIGGNAMYELNTSGDPLITTFPVPTNSVTNPDYLTNPNCSYQNGSIPINCNGPAYSYWAIDASAVDSASRPLTYSMTITTLSGNALIANMSANLHINAAGKISQTCPELPNSTACHDADGDAEYLITVSALPLGGNLPLVRTFKIKVRDDG